MAWTNSKIFRAYLASSLGRVNAFDLDADAFKAALFNNSVTPDQDAAAASTAYNTGTWLVANEVSQAGQWAAGGVALASQVLDSGTSATVFFDAADTASGTAATLTNAFGCLVYDDTLTTPVADQGVCFNYFGGANSVTSGTFTIVWSNSPQGIMRFSL